MCKLFSYTNFFFSHPFILNKLFFFFFFISIHFVYFVVKCYLCSYKNSLLDVISVLTKIQLVFLQRFKLNEHRFERFKLRRYSYSYKDSNPYHPFTTAKPRPIALQYKLLIPLNFSHPIYRVEFA